MYSSSRHSPACALASLSASAPASLSVGGARASILMSSFGSTKAGISDDGEARTLLSVTALGPSLEDVQDLLATEPKIITSLRASWARPLPPSVSFLFSRSTLSVRIRRQVLHDCATPTTSIIPTKTTKTITVNRSIVLLPAATLLSRLEMLLMLLQSRK
ncbi:uncharacterized protein PV06_07192 [Exophiala oligosperma]|uniref:Uncharacterized protein n=1 Tax=Exophiala oligosperma TaxID=215243 RepID=A0A0D2DGX0_9EURO|nr:uncharacterized protein PV06_07192 [Exophiala oligosperma]KIW41655.1 hypothetical protein PV06_07192 [Exophiala oligosperma]